MFFKVPEATGMDDLEPEAKNLAPAVERGCLGRMSYWVCFNGRECMRADDLCAES